MTGAGWLDTSVVIDWHDPAVRAALPDQVAISAVTAAELAAGPLLAATSIEAAKRQTRLQEVEALGCARTRATPPRQIRRSPDRGDRARPPS